MLKSKTARLVIAIGTGAASASASVNPNYSHCTSPAGNGICTDILYTTPLWLPNNTRYGTLHYLNTVEVTCWYYGNTSDGYWDHVVWESPFGYVTGHVDDGAVDFNGQTPPQVGLPKC
jgi:hypothetical protein